jgi:regulatory protein
MAGRTPLDAALDLLGRRDHSEEEMRRKLRVRKYSDEEISDVLAILREKGYLDDRRFAGSFAEWASRSGKAVGPRLVQELRRRGIGRETAAEAAAESAREHDPEDILRESLRRRFPKYDPRTADLREKRRVFGYFQRKGFDAGLVARLLREPAGD